MGKVQRKEACPQCRARGNDRSGDNLIVFDDGKYCFACQYFEGEGKPSSYPSPIKPISRTYEMKGVHAPLPNRSVSQRITEKFGVTVDNKTIYYPYHNSNGDTIGCKVRAEGKKFRTEGDITNAQLFGQHLWREGQKYVTITEGEEDALAVAEMFEGKYPVVSIKTGSGGALKDIKQNLEWLETFENIVLCFDNDDAGKAAVDQVLPLFSPQKARVVNLPLKDASDMLQAGRVRDFVSAWWEAKEYRPVGIVKFGDDEAWEAFLKRGTEEIIPLPESYRQLNDMLNGGVAAGEITLISAFTSIGKTTLVYNLLYDMALNSGKRIGGVFLEASVGENVEKMLSLHVGENISQLKQEERDNEGYKLYYDDLGENADYFILDHQGQADIDILFAKLRWMALGADCDVVILDPLQAAIKAADNDKVDEFMDRCLKLVKQTGLSMIMVSHLNKPMSTIKDPHYVSEYDTKGSGSINQIAFNHIMMTRDKMSDDEYTQNSTQLHLVKNRRVGRTGSAGWLYYEESTGRMVEGNKPELEGIKDDEF